MSVEPNPALRAALPELSQWDEGKGITVSGWLNTFGSVPQAIAYSTVFWPEFVEYEGCLVWSDCTPASFEGWMETLKGDKTRVEAVLNHVHITDLFLNAPDSPSDAQVEYFGLLLKKMWSLKLRSEFPLLDVQVDFYWNDREATDDAQITVYCQRHP